MSAWGEMMRRNRLTLLGAGVALLLGIWIVSNLFVPHRDARIEAIRQEGYPVAMSELDAYYPSVPDAENAAVVYTNAFALLTNLSGPNTRIVSALPAIGRGLSPDEEDQLKEILEDNAEALRLLYSAPASGRSRYAVRLRDGYNAMLPHLAKTRDAVTLLSTEGLMHATDGDAEKATHAFLAAARVAEALAKEPTIISQLVRYGAWAILMPRIERALSLATFTEGQLASLQKMIEGAERPRAMVRAMAVERATGINAITDRKVMGMALQQQGWNRQAADAFTTAAAGLLQASGLQQKDKAFYCDTMARHIAVLALPYPARAAVCQQPAMFTNAPNRFYFFSQLLLPALVKVYGREANHVANVRVAAAAIAVERFRLAHTNSLPQALEQLTPAYCAVLATDPFDGKPLRYKTHDGSYVVYSIGSDGQDDGGVNWEPEFSKMPQDTAFLVKKH
jgi:hypothetical protein